MRSFYQLVFMKLNG